MGQLPRRRSGSAAVAGGATNGTSKRMHANSLFAHTCVHFLSLPLYFPHFLLRFFGRSILVSLSRSVFLPCWFFLSLLAPTRNSSSRLLFLSLSSLLLSLSCVLSVSPASLALSLCPLSVMNALSLSVSLACSVFLSLSPSLFLSPALPLFIFVYLSLSHTHTHTHSLSHTHTHSLSLSSALSLGCCLDSAFTLFLSRSRGSLGRCLNRARALFLSLSLARALSPPHAHRLTNQSLFLVYSTFLSPFLVFSESTFCLRFKFFVCPHVGATFADVHARLHAIDMQSRDSRGAPYRAEFKPWRRL